MDEFPYRGGAKFVASFDFAIITMGVLIVIKLTPTYWSLAVFEEANAHYQGPLKNTEHSISSGLYWEFGIALTVIMLVFGVYLLASVMLFKAGTTEEDPKMALKMVLFWRYVSIVLLVLTVAGQWEILDVIGFISIVVWKVVSLIIIQWFFEGLVSLLTTRKRANEDVQPDNVTVV